MARIKNKQLIYAKKKRDAKICRRFEALYKKGLRTDAAIVKVVEEFALSEGTIMKILKGKY